MLNFFFQFTDTFKYAQGFLVIFPEIFPGSTGFQFLNFLFGAIYVKEKPSIHGGGQ
jgi:hypothetical protein